MEDCSTKWVELFALNVATVKDCAEEVFLRCFLPKRIISDKVPRFVCEAMQQLCYLFHAEHSLTPVYHSEANPDEQKTLI